MPESRVFCAIDTPDLDRALALARSLAGVVGGVKLGKEFFTACGPEGVRRIAALGLPIFLDLKYHDIPNTVAGAVRAAGTLGVAMLTVHASGGPAMLRAAAEAAADTDQPPLILGVTVLTSLDASDLETLGITESPADHVLRLGRLARDCGLDGVICAPREIGALRAELGTDFKLVVPGIRPVGTQTGDQKRTLTPAQAIAEGADFLVIGRPITGAEVPADAARDITRGLAEAA
jgi:orotidine-5'-phosphate decarboxylase